MRSTAAPLAPNATPQAPVPTPHWRLVVIPSLLALCLIESALADSLRCGRKVVKSGDSPSALIEHCGEPLYRATAKAEIETGSGRRSVRVERWHYKPSERSLERIVLIYRGEIVAVETGRR